MSNKNEVFEYLIDQLRQQVNRNQCEDLAHEVQSLKNQLRDASALVAELQEDNIKKSEHISHLSELVDELMGAITLMNGDVEAYKVLRKGGFIAKGKSYVVGEHAPAASVNCRCTPAPVPQEQSGCRKEDTQYNAWRPHYGARQPVPDGTMVFIRYRNGEEPKHSVAAEKRSWIWDGTYADIVEYKIDTQECEHDYRLVLWCSDLQQCSKCGAIK